MPIGRKAPAKSSEAPVIELPTAKVKILSAELHEEPYSVTSQSTGQTFDVEPNLNCKLVVVDDYMDGEWDGTEFYDSFKLKQEEDGSWAIRDGTKLGNLARAFYGPDFFKKEDSVFDEAAIVGFEFNTKLEQKKNRQGQPLQGTICKHDTIVPVPVPKDQRKAAEQAELEAEEDFEDLPF